MGRTLELADEPLYDFARIQELDDGRHVVSENLGDGVTIYAEVSGGTLVQHGAERGGAPVQALTLHITEDADIMEDPDKPRVRCYFCVLVGGRWLCSYVPCAAF